MVPPDKEGTIKDIKEGEFTVEETICTLEDGTELAMMHKWPVRKPRPFKKKLMPDIPLSTGQRILDALFPMAKGGTAAIPGGFGTGKTVTQQQLSKWCDAEIIVYVGCGERGNEMTEVLTTFPELVDPKSGRPLHQQPVRWKPRYSQRTANSGCRRSGAKEYPARQHRCQGGISSCHHPTRPGGSAGHRGIEPLRHAVRSGQQKWQPGRCR